MKYLHLYDKQTDYDNKKNTLILPTASLIEKNNHVEYNPHQYVEINGVKWATMNVGAKSITDYGLYFQWGDTQGYTADKLTGMGTQEVFSWRNYKYAKINGTTTSMTKYNSSDKQTVLELKDDAVHAAWGGSWRMPTTEELDNLKKTVTTGWTDNYNDSMVAGMVCTDKDGKQLFFPACGIEFNGKMYFVGSQCRYWLRELSTDNAIYAYELYAMEVLRLENKQARNYWNVVRGVWDDKLTKSNQ